MNSSTSDHTPPVLPGRILIAVDESMASQHAIAYARHLVAPHGHIRIVSVAEKSRILAAMGSFAGTTLEGARGQPLRDAYDLLTKPDGDCGARNFRIETETIDLSTHGSDIAHALIDSARAWQADLIVAGAHQHHGRLRWLEGSVSGPLVRLSACPILIVPATYDVKENKIPERILFAVDGSCHATQALHYGLRLATHDTPIRAIYVIDRAARVSSLLPIGSLERALQDALTDEGMRALATVKPILAKASARSSTALVRTARSDDDIAHTIVRKADGWQADLIVMGTHGRRGMAQWMLGSVAERVARLTHVPLLLVQAREV